MTWNVGRLALGTVAVVVLGSVGYAGYHRFLGGGSCMAKDHTAAVELSKSPLIVPADGSDEDPAGAHFRSACEDMDGLGEITVLFRGGGTPDAVVAEYRRRSAAVGYVEAQKGPEGLLCARGTTPQGKPVNFSLRLASSADGDTVPSYLVMLDYAISGQPWDCA